MLITKSGRTRLVKEPAISVVMSVFNGEEFLKKSINSILSQTFEDFEFIIVNDGSTDGTVQIIQDFASIDQRILLFECERRGLVKSLNFALDQAKGPLLARHDADDVSTPNRLAVAADFMKQNPAIAVAGSWCELIDTAGCVVGQMTHPADHESLSWFMIGYSTIAHPSAIMRREAIERYGRYDETFERAQDYELWTRWIKLGARTANIPQFLVKYRVSDGQVSKIFSKEQKESALRAASIYLNFLLCERISLTQLEAVRQLIQPWDSSVDLVPGTTLMLRLSKLERFKAYIRQNGVKAALSRKCASSIRVSGNNADRSQALIGLRDAVLLWPQVLLQPTWWIGLVKQFLPRS